MGKNVDRVIQSKRIQLCARHFWPFNIKTLIPFVILAAPRIPFSAYSYSCSGLCTDATASTNENSQCRLSKHTLLLVRSSSIGHKRHFSNEAAIPFCVYFGFLTLSTERRICTRLDSRWLEPFPLLYYTIQNGNYELAYCLFHSRK